MKAIAPSLEEIYTELQKKFNLFHADLLYRAIQDTSISASDFNRGFFEIYEAEGRDEDEFIPKGWENV